MGEVIAHLLPVGSRGQPPGEQPPETLDEVRPLMAGEAPPYRLARESAGWCPAARVPCKLWTEDQASREATVLRLACTGRGSVASVHACGSAAWQHEPAL